MLSTDINIT